MTWRWRTLAPGEDVGDEMTPAGGVGQSELSLRSCQESGGFLAWLTNSLKCLFYSEEKMLQLAGPDAVQYLRSVWSTLIGRGMSRLGSNWSRASL